MKKGGHSSNLDGPFLFLSDSALLTRVSGFRLIMTFETFLGGTFFTGKDAFFYVGWPTRLG